VPWLRDGDLRAEVREGRGRPRAGAGGGALFVERTAPRKEEPTEEQKDARVAARRAKKARQKANKAEKKAAAAAASEAERADYPHAQLRENVEFVMNGLEAATQAARNPTGSNIRVAYVCSLSLLASSHDAEDGEHSGLERLSSELVSYVGHFLLSARPDRPERLRGRRRTRFPGRSAPSTTR